MLYNPPTGSTDPNAPFVGKNVAAGIQGSRIPPKAVEVPQRELVSIVLEGELAPTNDDTKQVLRAIRSGKLWSYTATGTPNALVVNPITPHTQLVKGMPLRVFPPFTNTADATLSTNTLSGSIVRRDGSGLVGGDIVGGVPFDVVYDGSAWRIMGLAQAEVQRIVPTQTIWVRLDGDDSNDGTANTNGKAVRTIARAIYMSRSTIVSSGALVVRLGQQNTSANPYDAPNTIKRSGASILILGDVANQDKYVVAGAGAPLQPPIAAFSCDLQVSGFTMINTGTVADTIAASNGSTVLIDHVTFQAVGGSSFRHMASYGTGAMSNGDGIIIASGMGGWLECSGRFTFSPSTITFVGTPAWSSSGINCSFGGIVGQVGNPTFSGSTTGKRFNVTTKGLINSSGAGPNAFPGDVAGTQDTASGGLYV